MGELFERDGTCGRCGEPIYTDPMMGVHCGCPKWSPHHEPPRPSTWLPPGPDDALPRPVITIDGARNALAALAEEGLTVDSEGYCVPLDPVDFGLVPECEEPGCEGVGEVIDGARILCREHAPKVDDATLDLFDPFAELRRMGEEARAEPMTADDEKMLESIKAAVRRKLGET